MRKHPLAKCEKCPLQKATYVKSDIKESDILLIGKMPGQQEAIEGKVFVGPSGKMVDYVGGQPYSKTNLVACYPGDDLPDLAVECCSAKVQAEAQAHKYVMLLGADATTAFTGQKFSTSVGAWNGKYLVNYHPAYILRNAGLFQAYKTIFKKVEKGPVPPPKFDKVIAKTSEDVRDYFDSAASIYSFDIETSGFYFFDRKNSPRDFVTCILFFDGSSCLIVPFYLLGEKGTGKYAQGALRFLNNIDPGDARPIISEAFDRYTFIAHNGKFDVKFLKAIGINNARVHKDTILAHHLLFEDSPHDLKSLSSLFLDAPSYGHDIEKIGSEKGYHNIPFDDLNKYGALDVYYTYYLWPLFDVMMSNEDVLDLFYNITMPLSDALTEAEYKGVLLDIPHLHKWKKIMKDHLKEIKGELIRLVYEKISQLTPGERTKLIRNANSYSKTTVKMLKGEMPFNYRSPQMMGFAMYELFQIPLVEDWNVKKRSTSKHAIWLIQDSYPELGNLPIIQLLQKARRISDMISRYINRLLEDVDINNCYHDTFSVYGTEIGRVSSKMILLVPRPDDVFGNAIRAAFIPRPGHVFLDGDFSQVEIRMAGWVSGDKFLKEVYDSDRDLHSETTSRIFGPDYTKAQRSKVKTVNFKLQYSNNPPYSFGDGMTKEEFKKLVQERLRLTSDYTKFKDAIFEKAVHEEELVTQWGRKRRFPLITRGNKKEMMKSAPHFMVSSPCGDGNNLAFIQLWTMGYNPLFGVHDSIICEVPDDEHVPERARLMQSEMELIMEGAFPGMPWKAEVEVSKRWAPMPMFSDDIEEEPTKKGDYLLWKIVDI